MRKIFVSLLVLLTGIVITSCTEQVRTRRFGGSTTIVVPAGYKVTSATWKESDLFYFIEPMEEDYQPKQKKFIESSSYGILECEIIFNETKL